MSRRLLFAAAAALLTVTLCLAAIEAASRYRFSADDFDVNPLSLVTYDATFGWKLLPNIRGTIAWPGSAANGFVTNAEGFRDDPWPEKLQRAAQTGARKVLFLGDSLLYGWKIEAEDRVSEQLAQLGERRGRPYVTFNTGAPGYGTDQEYLVLLKYIDEIRPDAVVVFFCENDFGDAALPYDHRYRHRVYKPYFDLDGELLLNSPVPKRFSLRVKKTRLFRWRSVFFVDFLQCRLEDWRWRKFGVSENRRIHLPAGSDPTWGDEPIVLTMDNMYTAPEFEDLYQANKRRVFSLYRRMAKACRAHGARALVLAELSVGAAEGRHDREFYDELVDAGITPVFDADALRPFADYDYVNYDGHPNCLANAIHALAVYEALEGGRADLDFAAAPWFAHVPRTVDLAAGVGDEFTFGRMSRRTPDGRWLAEKTAFLLRQPAGLAARLVARGAAKGAACELTMMLDDQPLGRVDVASGQAFELAFLLPPAERERPLFVKLLARRPDASGRRQPMVVLREIGVKPTESD